MATPGPGQIQMDERWFSEWFEKGYADLIAYLARHARFDRWLAEHHREEPV